MISTYLRKVGTRFLVAWMFLFAAVVIMPASAQRDDYASESLFMALFANGDALVEYDVSIQDPLDEEIRIKLFGGTHINDLIVVDFEDELVEYDIGDSPNEIVLNTPGVSNVRISYTTPDLVNRFQGIWTFSLNATTGFSVRLPPDTVLVDYEPFPAIKIVNDQPLLTFDESGEIRVSYAIGVLGTEEQASIAIRLATAAIKEARDKHPDIILTDAEDILQSANEAFDDGRFGDAELRAGQASDAAVAANRDYESAQSAIADTDNQIDLASGEGRDIATAAQLLERARTEFASGSYMAAGNSAKEAVAAIGDIQTQPALPVSVIVAGLAAAGGGVGALVFLRIRKQPAKAALHMQKRETPPRAPANNKATTMIRPPISEEKREVKLVSDKIDGGLPAIPDMIPESQIDKSVLGRIVGMMLEERPHLRPEDQQVLRFLAEKEGAAFESEIRTKFQLPKTTIWRLVKRLEREELVEIRKAGGQNLIKLKFEDKIP